MSEKKCLEHLVADGNDGNDGNDGILTLQGLEDKSPGCEHSEFWQVAVARRKEDLRAHTTLLDTTSRCDFERWERCLYLYRIFWGMEVDTSSCSVMFRQEAFTLWESRGGQFGNLATL